MHFKFMKLSTFILSLVLLGSGCGWLKDKPKAQTSFQSQSLNCLNQLNDKIQKLFSGKYTDSDADQLEIEGAFTCMDNGLKTFSENTRGAIPGQYTAAELRSFANRYLDQDRAISRELIDSVFNLKSAILGGNANLITQKEIVRLREMLTDLKGMAKPLAGKISTIMQPTLASEEQRKVASKQLNIFVNQISVLLENTGGPISWRNLTSFVTELEKYTSEGQPNALTVLREQLPVLQYFKLLIVGGDEFAIEKNKWRPILLSVANIYNAINFTNLTIRMEDLDVQILSTDQEQRRAVAKINALLKTLKDDPKLYSHDTVVMLADRWGKVLLANSILFPSTQGSIAIRIMFDSPVIRKLTGYILDQVVTMNVDQPSVAQMVQISEYVQSLVEQTALAIEPNSQSQTQFSVSSFKEYAVTIKPLFVDEQKYQMFLDGIDLLQNLRAMLLGKTQDSVKASEFKDLLKKLTDLYVIWSVPSSKLVKGGMMDALSQSLEVLNRAPFASNIKVNTVVETLKQAQEILKKAEIRLELPWDKLTLWTQKGFALKGLLFGSSDQIFYNLELRKLTNLLEPFRTNEDFGKQLALLSELLKSNPFTTIKTDALVSVITPIYDTLELPKLPFELNGKNIGLAKALILGGSQEKIEQADYTLIVYAASKFVTNIFPELDSLPKDFLPGINSKTMNLGSIALATFADFQREIAKQKDTGPRGLDLVNIKELALLMAPSMGLTLVPKNLDDFLIGFPYRVFQKQKGPKPTTLSGSILPEHLEMLIGVLDQTKLHLIDLEHAYAGLDQDTQPVEGKKLKSELKDATLLQFLSNYRPQLMGKDHVFMQPKLGQTFTQYYYFDLAYKAMVSEFLKIILPAYKIEPDPENLERLSLKDLTDLLQDINNMLTDLEIAFGYEPAALTATKRMVTINSFTLTGNGDSFLEPTETIDFLTMTFGGTVLLNNARKVLGEKCAPGKDWKKVKEYPGTCFLPTYFSSNFYNTVYGETLPQMANAVSMMSKEDLENFKMSTLITAAPDLINKPAYDLADLQSIALLPEYIESIFIRLDHSADATIQFSEAMSGFPLFCEQIQSGAKGKLKGSCKKGYFPNQIEAIFGFMLMNGEAPRGPKPGDSIWRKLKEGVLMLKWFKEWKKLSRDPTFRDALPPQITRKDLMTLLANLALAAPLEIPQEDDQFSSETISAF